MRYRIEQIKLNVGESHEALKKAIKKKLGKKELKIGEVEIVRESVDARRKPDVKLVYTVDFSCDEKLPLKEPVKKEYDLTKVCGNIGMTASLKRPVVIGFGPAGMFAGLILAEAGLKPLIVERGQKVDERVRGVEEFWETGRLNTESNVQFGEGGAGTFSDGKLTTGIKDFRISKVLKEFVLAGADEKIRYKQKPHIGTDRLRAVVKNIRIKIGELGGEFMFSSKVSDIDVEGGRLKGIYVEDVSRSGNEKRKFIETEYAVIATGHSARDTFRMLYEHGISMEQKPFSIGVRIEHPQEMINEAQYGDGRVADIIGPAEYKLNHRCQNGRGVYTFCMCPGGEVIDSSSEENTAVTNGMSNSARDGRWANSGLLVDVRTEDFSSEDPFAGIEFQRKYEKLAYEMGKGKLPVSYYGSFRESSDDPVRKSLPSFAAEAIIEAMPHMGKKLKGFDREDARFTAVETRSSSPVRIYRGETGETDIRGMFPAGEGPGYAGGIMSAAVDGIKVAEKLIKVIFS